jgi:hypothetical protein
VSSYLAELCHRRPAALGGWLVGCHLMCRPGALPDARWRAGCPGRALWAWSEFRCLDAAKGLAPA